MAKYIAPSIMCADMMNLSDEVKVLESCSAELIHVDVMDGVFVDNYALGTDFVDRLHRITDIPLDVHLMVENPEDKLKFFNFRPNDFVSVHAEATRHLQKTLAQIKETGARPAVAINPATPLSVLDHILDDVAMILIMTVNPGFAGQKMVPATLEKIALLKKRLRETGRENILIEVDGNVSFENAAKMNEAGADIFVAGTSSVYAPGATITENFVRMRKVLTGAW